MNGRGCCQNSAMADSCKSLSINVLERTRELAVMKTLGATPRRLVGTVLAEAQCVGVLSGVGAFALSLPLTALLDALVGGLGFVALLPFAIAWTPASR